MPFGRRTTIFALGAVALMLAAGACSSDKGDPPPTAPSG